MSNTSFLYMNYSMPGQKNLKWILDAESIPAPDVNELLSNVHDKAKICSTRVFKENDRHISRVATWLVQASLIMSM